MTQRPRVPGESPAVPAATHLPQLLPVQVILDVPGGFPAHLPAARQDVHVVHLAVQTPCGRLRVSFCVCKGDEKKNKSPIRGTLGFPGPCGFTPSCRCQRP